MDLLYPRRWVLCDRALPAGTEGVCADCAGKLRVIREPWCLKCGKPLRDERAEYCVDCRQRTHAFLQGRALYEYKSVSRSMLRFKAGGRYEYGRFYGRRLAEELGDTIRSWKPECIVAVPVHRSRLRTRGYNQAEVIARSLGRELGIPVDTRLIKRSKKTVPLKNLTLAERQNNLKKAFKLCRNDVKLKTIIVVDDIYTTGSTMDAVAQVLKGAGIERVYCVCAAIGKG